MIQNLKSWEKLTSEIAKWAMDCYGKESEPWQLFLGILEEIGEFSESSTNAKRKDSLGDQTIYALNLKRLMGVKNFHDGAPMPRVNMERLFRASSRFSRALLKNSQGIRGFSQEVLTSEATLFLATWWSWATTKAALYMLPSMLEITNDTWEEVSRRNWKEYPVEGVASEKQ